MTLLPPAVPKPVHSLLPEAHGIVEEKEEDANYAHNWLYSVVPIGILQKESFYKEYPSGQGGTLSVWETQLDYPLAAYLTGFCRECRKAFSHPIPHEYGYLETQMEVPYYGCVKPGTNR